MQRGSFQNTNHKISAFHYLSTASKKSGNNTAINIIILCVSSLYRSGVTVCKESFIQVKNNN